MAYWSYTNGFVCFKLKYNVNTTLSIASKRENGKQKWNATTIFMFSEQGDPFKLKYGVYYKECKLQFHVICCWVPLSGWKLNRYWSESDSIYSLLVHVNLCHHRSSAAFQFNFIKTIKKLHLINKWEGSISFVLLFVCNFYYWNTFTWSVCNFMCFRTHIIHMKIHAHKTLYSFTASNQQKGKTFFVEPYVRSLNTYACVCVCVTKLYLIIIMKTAIIVLKTHKTLSLLCDFFSHQKKWAGKTNVYLYTEFPSI